MMEKGLCQFELCKLKGVTEYWGARGVSITGIYFSDKCVKVGHSSSIKLVLVLLQ